MKTMDDTQHEDDPTPEAKPYLVRAAVLHGTIGSNWQMEYRLVTAVNENQARDLFRTYMKSRHYHATLGEIEVLETLS